MKHYLWHRFVIGVLRVTAGPVVKSVMGYSCKKQKGPELPSLVISNHVTDLDPALVSLGFSRHIYFVTSEHALRGGIKSKLLKFVFDPVPINKARTDVASIKEMIRRLKAGANICLFAEGDRSFNGLTSPVSLSTAKLAKTSGADLVTFRIEGGYFLSPRWSRRMRKGKTSGAIVSRYSAAELKSLTNEQVLGAIERDIYENAYERQKVRLERYRGDGLAEDIQTVLCMCPVCKKIGSIISEGDRFSCSCGLEAVYTELGLLEGESLPFSTITDWDIWQTEELANIVRNIGDETICEDEDQQLYVVRAAVGKTPAGRGTMKIDRKAFHCAGLTFPLDQITHFTVAGQMTRLFAVKDGETFEVLSDAPRSALKYREIFKLLTADGK